MALEPIRYQKPPVDHKLFQQALTAWRSPRGAPAEQETIRDKIHPPGIHICGKPTVYK